MKPKILAIDIEISPALCYTWNTYEANIPPEFILEEGRILCFAAQWLHDREIIYYDSKSKASRSKMLKRLHKLLDEADIVLHYNGRKFDVPFINTEFLKHGLGSYSPILHIDLLAANRRCFRYQSNRFAHVTNVMQKHKLLPQSKGDSGGNKLWKACVDGNESAWNKLKRYNIRDVRVTVRYFRLIREWLPQTSGFKRVMEYVNGQRQIRR